jgi:hypothetical protein
VLTLSIIPIQRAGEVWSPSIVRLYRRDPVTFLTFVVLGILCGASFLFAVRGIAGLSASLVLAASIAVLGISLDILRWYHAHICKLLDPTHAVQLALSRAKQTVDETQRIVSRLAQFQYRHASSEQKAEATTEDIQAALYPRVRGYPAVINAWINDLAEIAVKASSRGEKLLARSAVFSIADLTVYYLESRKNNLTLRPAPEALMLAMTSDVAVVTDRAYEALQEISRAAVAQADEATAIHVTNAYQLIAIKTANLGASAFRQNTAPLTFAPIFYALACIKYAQSKGLKEVAFQAAASLARIPLNAPKNVEETDIIVPVVDGLHEIAANLYGTRDFGLAEEVNGNHFTILRGLLERDDFYFEDSVRHVLEKMESLAPLAIINERMAGRVSIVRPLQKAYGLVSPDSLGYLFARAAQIFPKIDEEREWLNPHSDLIDFAELIYRHLRDVAESNEFGDSFLIWEIDHLIKQVAEVIERLIGEPLRPDHGDEDELIDRLIWIMTFYWVAFHAKKTIDDRRADECCDSLTYIGLLYHSRGHPEVLRATVSNIRSILESYCEIARPPDPYSIANILAHLWGIRLVVAARGEERLTGELNTALESKPESLTPEQWAQAQRAIHLRRRQLEERLRRRPGRRSSEAMMRRLLDEARRGQN